MQRVLKKGGILILNTPFFYWLHEEPYDYYRHTKFALKSLAEDAGFRIIQLESIGGALEIISDILSKTIIHVPLLGNLVALIFQRLSWWFSRTSLGHKISVKSGRKFPYLYGVVAEKI